MSEDTPPVNEVPKDDLLHCPHCQKSDFKIHIISAISATHECLGCHRRFKLIYSTSFKRTAPRFVNEQVR